MLNILWHLIATAFRAFAHIVITAVIAAVLGVGAVLAITYFDMHQLFWPPRGQMTLVALWA